MRFGLRTLMILMALGPPLLALLWWYKTPFRFSLGVVIAIVLSVCLGWAGATVAKLLD
jgi:hypothetical protein